MKSNLSIAKNKDIAINILVKVNENLSQTVNEKLQISVIKSNENTITKEFKNEFLPSQLVLNIAPKTRPSNAELRYGYTCNYRAKIKNLTNEELKNVKITINKNELISISSILYGTGENIEEIDGKETFIINSILPNDTVYIEINASATNKNTRVDSANISFTAENSNGNIYKSNLLSEKVQVAKLDIDVNTKSTANNSDRTVRENDSITYTAKIKNTGKIDVENVDTEVGFSYYLELQSIKLNNKDYSKYEMISNAEETSEYNTIKIENLSLKVGEELTLEIKGKVSDNLPDNNIIKVVNKFSVYQDSLLLCESEENEYTIKNETEENSSDDENNNQNNNNNNNNNNSNEGNSSNNNLFEISGIVWEDSNNNGRRDLDEKTVEGIKVYAIDVTTNRIVTNNEQDVITDNEGKYTLTNLEKGNYIVVFEYNTGKYMVTTYQAKGIDSTVNSDAIKASRVVNGETKTAAYTDSINLTENKSNIDLGLVESKEFSLSLEKSISKVTVSNKKGTKKYDFDDSKLAKVEIAGKDLSESNVVIEYKIKVKNTGEIAGYAKSIVDYMPSSLTFNSGMNKNWYKKGNKIYTSSLANKIIEPGESKEVVLTLTKKMTKSNTGLINNKAEIENASNDLGVDNISKTDNSLNSADVIIGIKTGSGIKYIILTFAIIIIICGLIYLDNKKNMKEE